MLQHFRQSRRRGLGINRLKPFLLEVLLDARFVLVNFHEPFFFAHGLARVKQKLSLRLPVTQNRLSRNRLATLRAVQKPAAAYFAGFVFEFAQNEPSNLSSLRGHLVN
jgi:hypothetical protein